MRPTRGILSVCVLILGACGGETSPERDSGAAGATAGTSGGAGAPSVGSAGAFDAGSTSLGASGDGGAPGRASSTGGRASPDGTGTGGTAGTVDNQIPTATGGIAGETGGTPGAQPGRTGGAGGTGGSQSPTATGGIAGETGGTNSTGGQPGRTGGAGGTGGSQCNPPNFGGADPQPALIDCPSVANGIPWTEQFCVSGDTAVFLAESCNSHLCYDYGTLTDLEVTVSSDFGEVVCSRVVGADEVGFAIVMDRAPGGEPTGTLELKATLNSREKCYGNPISCPVAVSIPLDVAQSDCTRVDVYYDLDVSYDPEDLCPEVP